MAVRPLTLGVLSAALLAACGAPSSSEDLIFVDGRATAVAGDSLLALTRQGIASILTHDRRTGALDTIGTDVLKSPHHIQEHNGRWYVSDAEDGRPSIAVFSADGQLEQRIPLERIAPVAHQFALLPDGRIVTEASDGRLAVLTDDAASTFAITERGSRTGFVIAAQGGVIHAVPDRAITLYNELGNIRWRLSWPWYEGAFVSDLAVDTHGRIHVLAGEQGRNVFRVFTLSPVTGEVVRWSVPGPSATFVVDRLGQILPDSADRWLGG